MAQSSNPLIERMHDRAFRSGFVEEQLRVTQDALEFAISALKGVDDEVSTRLTVRLVSIKQTLSACETVDGTGS